MRFMQYAVLVENTGRVMIATMLGAAETDALDDKSNVWRSAMLNARTVIAKCGGR